MRQHTWSIAVALLAATAPGASLAAAQTVVRAVPQELPAGQQASQAAALRFAVLYLPKERTKAAALQGFRRTFETSFDQTPENVALEKRFPGTRDSAVASGAEALVTLYDQKIPDMQAHIADYVRRYLTEPQLNEVTAFLASRTGQRVQLLAAQSSDMEARMVKKASDPDTFKVTGKEIIDSMNPGFISKLSPEEIRETAAFGATTAGVRFYRAAPSLVDLIAQETTTLINDCRVQIQAAIMAGVGKHVSASQKRIPK